MYHAVQPLASSSSSDLVYRLLSVNENEKKIQSVSLDAIPVNLAFSFLSLIHTPLLLLSACSSSDYRGGGWLCPLTWRGEAV